MSHNDLSEEEKTTKATYEKHGAVWARNRGNEDFYAEEVKTFQRLLPKGRILDLGSGAGRDAKVFTELGYDYTGIDISDTLLEIARQNVPQAKFLKQNLYNLDFIDKFDGLWAAAVLVHVPKVRINEALSSVKKILNPGAICFINVKAGTGEEMEDYEIEPGTVLKRFYSFWDKAEFEKTLQQASFKILSYHYRNVADTQKWHCFFVKLK
jgi:SAM-dependent methyltransferase